MVAARYNNGHVVRVAAYSAAVSRQNTMTPFTALSIAGFSTVDTDPLDSSVLGPAVEYLGVEFEGGAVSRRPLTRKGVSPRPKTIEIYN